MQRIREITEGCEFREGKGNPDGRLMVVFLTPEFTSQDMVRNFLNDLNIPGRDIYATSFYKKRECEDEEMLDVLLGELAIVEPDLVWLVGEVKDKVGVEIPWEICHGLYVNFIYSDLLGVTVPSASQVASMPKDVKKTLWSRMTLIAEDYHGSGPSTKNYATDFFFKNFCSDFDLNFDKSMLSPNCFWSFYSDKFQQYFHVVLNKEMKKLFEEKVPFGVPMTENELKEVKDSKDFVHEVAEMFGGKVEKIG